MIGMMRAYHIARRWYKDRGNKWYVRKWMNVFGILYGCHLSASCSIGSGTQLGYNGRGVVIHDKCVIGKECMISQNVTLGGKDTIPGQIKRKVHIINGEKLDVPRLGNHVKVGAGAVILGGVVIGDYAIIGANAVVLDDVPANTIVAGVPAKIIREVGRTNETSQKETVQQEALPHIG